tara:strand:- start:30 stop:731 length:702 start_codon:yes stop_codon:yes gene_type:complete
LITERPETPKRRKTLIIVDEESLEIVHRFGIQILVDAPLRSIAPLLNSGRINAQDSGAIISKRFLTHNTKNIARREHTKQGTTVKRNRFAQMVQGLKISRNHLVQTAIGQIQRSRHATQSVVFNENLSFTRKSIHLARLRILKNKFPTPLKGRKSSVDWITKTKQIITVGVNGHPKDMGLKERRIVIPDDRGNREELFNGGSAALANMNELQFALQNVGQRSGSSLKRHQQAT